MSAAGGSGGGGAGAGAGGPAASPSVGSQSAAQSAEIGAPVGLTPEASSTAPGNSISGEAPKSRRSKSPEKEAKEVKDPAPQQADLQTVLKDMDRRARQYDDAAQKSTSEKVVGKIETIAEQIGTGGRPKVVIWVEKDLKDLGKRIDESYQEAIKNRIAENARNNSEYHKVLQRVDASLADRAEKAPGKSDKAQELERRARQRQTLDEKERAAQALDAAYVVVGHEYRFRNDPSRTAFRDEGKKMTTEYNTTEVARGLVDALQAKGWSALSVTGTEEFRRNVWLEAEKRGVTVRGYEPTKLDKELLERARKTPENAVEKVSERQQTKREVSQEAPPPASRQQPVAAEQVVAMGAAPYKFDKREADSYYIKLRDAQGREREVWGKDLERAAAASAVQVGDAIRLRVKDKQPVEVVVNIRDAQDKIVGREPKATRRNQWEIERVDVRAEAPPRVLDKVLEQRGVSAELRERVRDAADHELSKRRGDGREPQVQVFDPNAARQIERPARQIDPARQRDRGSPTRG